MSSQTLLPCPNPHCAAQTRPRIWTSGIDCMTQCNFSITCECGVSVAGRSRDEVVTLWNSLPRAHEWTNESPKVPGLYWNRSKNYPNEACILRVTQGRIDQLKRMGCGPNEQWAGPILKPREPK